MTNRRSVIGSLSAAALALVLPRAASGGRSHGLVEIAEDGLPYRASTQKESAYYWPMVFGLQLRFNGEVPSRCYEFDRREGWVLCDDEECHPQPRRYGRVEVWAEWPKKRAAGATV